MTQDIAARGKRKGKREVRVRNGERRVEKEKGRKRREILKSYYFLHIIIRATP